jgi:tRNA pseudouridine38-40 synthase
MTLFDELPVAGAATPVAEPERARLRAIVAYDGSAFHGFAAQPGVVTVAGTLADALARVLRVAEVELTCAGRTDTGVHAWGQVVSFDVPLDALDPRPPRGRRDPTEGADRLGQVQRAVNKLCGPAVVLRSLEHADPDFDARFSARARVYRYTVVNRPWPDPFLARTAWHVSAPLDLRAMTLACDPFIGEHDFSAFCRRPKPPPGAEPATMTRRIVSARWADDGDGILHLWIEANAFCHQMVRSITGTMVEVGLGRKRAGEVMGIIRGRDRQRAGDLAPPQGLCLWEVRYDGPPAPARVALAGGSP